MSFLLKRTNFDMHDWGRAKLEKAASGNSEPRAVERRKYLG